MIDTTAGLQFEIRRLRDIVEKQYLEIAWQQSELRSRGGKAKIFKFGAGDLAHTNLTGNAGLLRETVELPPQDVWPTGATPANPLIPNCGFASYASGRDRIAATGISVCGLDEQSVEHIAGMVEDGDRASSAEKIPCGLGSATRVWTPSHSRKPTPD